MASLDDMLSDEDGGGDLPLGDEGDDMAVDEDDSFTMNAETFLDDSLSMPERVEALRAAILAASAPPPDEEL
jgi:hypothetical protein